VPTFLRGNYLRNANLSLVFNESNTVNLGQIASNYDSKNEFAYNTLSIQGSDLSINSMML